MRADPTAIATAVKSMGKQQSTIVEEALHIYARFREEGKDVDVAGYCEGRRGPDHTRHM